MSNLSSGSGDTEQLGLFDSDPLTVAHTGREADRWPDPTRFPVNRSGAVVADHIVADLVASESPLIVAGFGSLGEIIALIDQWSSSHATGSFRLLLGSEPFATQRTDFRSTSIQFTEDVRRYWIEERNISIDRSAQIVLAVELIDQGRVTAKREPLRQRLHAKIYCGDRAASLGSSNFTSFGLRSQLEANVRADVDDDDDDYHSIVTIAENYWQVGVDWTDHLRQLLHDLLQVVSWEEALARACANLLEGEWAQRYLSGLGTDVNLWPSQRSGIAQALWILDTVGSVLISDATGSGKTRMGAHLLRALRDRLWNSGQARDFGSTAIVCPKAVMEPWEREAIGCRLQLDVVSNGVLSNPGSTISHDRLRVVHHAQVIALDEAHQFLQRGSKRSRQIERGLADHVVLFTATPINRGVRDLIRLVDLLGADNFSLETLEVLKLLRTNEDLDPGTVQQLRREIQRFTVRRTKTELNELVKREPEGYRHPISGQICQYPLHMPKIYDTGETEEDERLAMEIRRLGDALRGIVQLGEDLRRPRTRPDIAEERWLRGRLAASAGLARSHVLRAMRSSELALVEHIIGTTPTRQLFDIREFKQQASGNLLAKLVDSETRRPSTDPGPHVPDWLNDDTLWARACREEHRLYSEIVQLAMKLSPARLQQKAATLFDLVARHDRILAFDHHLITLAALEPMLAEKVGKQARVLVATGNSGVPYTTLQRALGRESTDRVVALCSDAMNQGLNLQGASALVQLDLPTTLRVAEQRAGRIDRMDSPHREIEVFWPNDGPAFVTRANEMLIARLRSSHDLLGSNLELPDAIAIDRDRDQTPIDIGQQISQLSETQIWDGIHDALEPVRRLIEGPTALVPPDVYEAYRSSGLRVSAAISLINATEAWAFFALEATSSGSPQWLLFSPGSSLPLSALDDVVEQLRELLVGQHIQVHFDSRAVEQLKLFLSLAEAAEWSTLPRRIQAALAQLERLAQRWAANHPDRVSDLSIDSRWRRIARAAVLRPAPSDPVAPDPYAMGRAWLQLVAPYREAYRDTNPSRPFTLLRDIDSELQRRPPSIDAVEAALSDLAIHKPIGHRVTACILGVPAAAGSSP